MARPAGLTDYTDELAKEICDVISVNAIGLRVLCEQRPHWPNPDTIYSWLNSYKSFSEQYARAKQLQAEVYAERAIEVAFDGSLDTIVDDKGNKRCDHEWLGRSKLIVDTIKWHVAVLKPKKYAQKSMTENEHHVTVEESTRNVRDASNQYHKDY